MVVNPLSKDRHRIIKVFELENRFIKLENNLDEEINYDIVFNKIAELRLVSQKFLIDAIDKINENYN